MDTGEEREGIGAGDSLFFSILLGGWGQMV